MGCASYSYFLQSAQPYSRAPYYQCVPFSLPSIRHRLTDFDFFDRRFSEQSNDVYATNGGTNPAYTFLTGHGGFLQTLTHGFTGYRSRLAGLYLDPVLPPQFTNYTVKGLKWRSSSFDINVATANTTITRKSGGNETVAVEIAAGNGKAGN